MAKFIDVSGVEFATPVTFSGAVSQTGDQSVTGTLSVTGNVTSGGQVQGATMRTAGAHTVLGSLVVSGATVVGLDVPVTVYVPELSAGQNIGVASPVAGTVVAVRSRLCSVHGGADATVTPRIGSTAMTAGALTIAVSGAAIGDIDSSTPSAANTVAVGSDLNVLTSGSAEGGSATVTFTVRRTA